MTTTLKGVELESKDSLTIQSWVKEINLHKLSGKLYSLPQACELILSDFAQTLRLTDDQIKKEKENREMVKRFTTDVDLKVESWTVEKYRS